MTVAGCARNRSDACQQYSEVSSKIASVQGEGRLAAATRQLMLGEALPPVLLILTDSHGNRIEHLDEGLGKVEVAVRPAQATSPGRASHLDIQVTSAQVQLQFLCHHACS